MFKSLSIKTLITATTSIALALGIAAPARAEVSLGSSNTFPIYPAMKPADVNSSLGANPLRLTGYSADQTLLAVVTTTSGKLNVTTTTGITAATGYQSPVTGAAASIALVGTAENINSALNSLKVTPGIHNTTVQKLTLTVSNRGSNSVAYNATNGHYYEFVDATKLNWNNAFRAVTGLTVSGTAAISAESVNARKAQTAASGCAKSFNGMCGYFATSTSEDENTFITTKVGTSAAWLGATDINQVDKWVWYDPKAPEHGVQLSNGSQSFNGSFVNWNRGEPNGGTNENAMQLLAGGTGKWNDLREAHTDPAAILGYVVEYGGIAGETATLPTISRTFSFETSQTYVASFDIGSSASGTAPAEGWYKSGETFVVPAGTGITPPTGKKFKNWYDGTNYVEVGSTYTMAALHKTFQAQYVEDLPAQTDSATSISPTSGLQGTSVTITGSFSKKVTSIYVDSAIVSASQITQTATTLTFTMPRHSEGVAAVKIKNGASPEIAALSFTFGKPAANKASIIPYDGEWGTVNFTGLAQKLDSNQTAALDVLIKGISDMVGTKVITLTYIKLNNPKKDSLIANYNKVAAGRFALIKKALLAKMSTAKIVDSPTTTNAPKSTADLASAVKYSQVVIKLKNS
jgi:hypothetical protein